MPDVTFTDQISVTEIDACADDLGVVNAARVSVNDESVNDESIDLTQGDELLIRSLMRNGHSSPFRHNLFKFRVEAPLFIAREAMRHHVGHAWNELSLRYSEANPKFWVPLCARRQVGGAMSYTYENLPRDGMTSERLRDELECVAENAWASYKYLRDLGVAREQARAVLPVSVYTKFIWTCNAGALMQVLELRNAPEAQAEIRDMAAQAEKALARHMPITYAAFLENERKAP